MKNVLEVVLFLVLVMAPAILALDIFEKNHF
jgi:hypothetical protein